jgi:hypothetical protein
MITTRAKRTSHTGGIYAPGESGYAPSAVTDPYVALFGYATRAVPTSVPTGAHPLYDPAHNRRLLEREGQITSALDAIEPALKEVAAMQWQEGFADRAQSLVTNRLGFELPDSCTPTVPSVLSWGWRNPSSIAARRITPRENRRMN